MNNQYKNLEMIKLIAEGLGNSLLKDIIFVGGAVSGLYATSQSAPEVRYTEDVDCIISLSTKTNFNNLEKELRNRSFENDIRENASICRWMYQGITVDIMPVDSHVLGFTNNWYKNGFDNIIKKEISYDLIVNILSAPYFLATKLEAHNNRGGYDIDSVMILKILFIYLIIEKNFVKK